MDSSKVKSILIDTKNKKFELNGVDISNCTHLEITFKDGEWTIRKTNTYIGKADNS